LSGEAIRHANQAERADLIAAVLDDRGGARSVLLDAVVRCDIQYVLAAAGLLAKSQVQMRASRTMLNGVSVTPRTSRARPG
jgi:hypothetical protein